jgi:Arc/MetJ-type ribon-helix-helix transcriptional regulator
MTRLTITISDTEEEMIDENVGEGNEYESKSAFVRAAIQRYERAAELEAKTDDLQRQLREANRHNDDVTDLAEYVDRERQLRIEERERRRAPLRKRIEWFVFGYDR